MTTAEIIRAGYPVTLPVTLTNESPDDNGITNLQEYAFWGNPKKSSQSEVDGSDLLPSQEASPEGMSLTFPRQTDAAARGLSYRLESSFTLLGGSWDLVASDSGTTSSDPGPPGFEQIRRSFPLDEEKRFFCVHLVLDE